MFRIASQRRHPSRHLRRSHTVGGCCLLCQVTLRRVSVSAVIPRPALGRGIPLRLGAAVIDRREIIRFARNDDAMFCRIRADRLDPQYLLIGEIRCARSRLIGCAYLWSANRTRAATRRSRIESRPIQINLCSTTHECPRRTGFLPRASKGSLSAFDFCGDAYNFSYVVAARPGVRKPAGRFDSLFATEFKTRQAALRCSG